MPVWTPHDNLPGDEGEHKVMWEEFARMACNMAPWPFTQLTVGALLLMTWCIGHPWKGGWKLFISTWVVAGGYASYWLIIAGNQYQP